MRKVFVTGCYGFIASHLCDHLIDAGYEVAGIDNLDPQVHGPSPKIPLYANPNLHGYICDVRDRSRLETALQEFQPDAVIHLAAKVGVGQSAYEMADYTSNNVWGTGVLLDALTKSGIKKLIAASSMSVYGEGYCHPVNRQPWATNEDKPPDLQSVYALTKYDQERLCLLFGRAYNVPTIALRFFNVVGTRQSLSNPYTGVMAIFASRLLNNKPPIIFEDGLQSRDFVHVSDVVRGIRLALESAISDEVINIGSGCRYTILELAERLAAALGSNIKPAITGQTRVGDIRHCFADISKARELLGYEPQMSLEDGISELVEWLRTQSADDRLEEHKAELEARGLLA